MCPTVSSLPLPIPKSINKTSTHLQSTNSHNRNLKKKSHEMTTYNQHKPKRTKGLGFVPPTLRLQHQVRLPFVKTDQKSSGAEGEVAKSKRTASPATESQEVDSQSQEADRQCVKSA